MSILQDILRDDLAETDKKILVNRVFESVFTEGFTKQDLARSKTLGNSKSLLEFYELVNQAIENYETRSNVTEENKIVFTEEEPDVEAQHEAITFSLIKRMPGAFGKGAPFKSDVTNQRPMIREVSTDPEEPDYRQVIFGYWYDNIVRFTCWARTNKIANARAQWFEDLMEEYSWWFKLQGVNRVLFSERRSDTVITIRENKWYGRPIDYFVRTEKLRVHREKQLEEILLKVSITS